MATKKRIMLESLVGETLSSIDVLDDKSMKEQHQILLTTCSGRRILITHERDCCEFVRIESTQGQWKDLIGRVILLASDVDEEMDKNEYGMSATETTLTFKTDKDTVICKWIGESNGYYSESVDIFED